MSASNDFSIYDDLETDRLILRPPNLGDIETIFFLRTDTSLNKYIKRNPPSSHKEIEMFIHDRLKDRKDGKSIYWVISTKQDPERCIGALSLWQFSEDRKMAEVGYDLHPDRHGQSIMSEAIKAVLWFGKNVLNFDRVEAFTHKENIASLHLLKSNHFVLTDIKDPGVPTNVVYAIQLTRS
jgi:ribosomal-protein-alanine N-acetyltransferase